MEMEQMKPNGYNEDQVGDNDGGNWRRRLRLRKSSAHAVNSSFEQQKFDKALTKESSQTEQKDHQVVDSANSKLTFTCSDCKDGTRFSPDGLLKHFQNFHGGKGQPPCFPCDMCSFVASDFTTLQQHYPKHKNSRLTCEPCNDKGMHMPFQLTKHFKTQCKECMLSTKELNLFHNSCPHNTSPTIDGSEKSSAKPTNGELNRSLLADAAGEPQKDTPVKHVTTACHRGWSRKNWWKNRDHVTKQNKPPVTDVKFLIPQSDIPQWPSANFLPFSAAGLLDENGELLHPTRTLEETKQFLEKTVNYGKTWPVTLKGEPDLSCLSCPGTLDSEPKMKRCVTPLPVPNSGNELSGLMEKNNISVPPDCTTRVVGFKMVDGKKHLVLKVIPSAKPEVSSDTGEKPAGLSQEGRNAIQLDPHIERPSDQICSESGTITIADSTINGYDSTSNSCQPKKQGLGKEEDQEIIGNAPQVDNTENECSNGQCVCSEGLDPPAQLTLSGIEDINVECQTKNEKTASPEVTFDDTDELSGENADVISDIRSVSEADIQPLQANVQEINDLPKHTDNQGRAARDYKEIHSEPSTSQDHIRCVEHLSSSTSSDFGNMEEGMNAQLLTVMSEKDRSSEIYRKNMDNIGKSGEKATIIQFPLDYWNEQRTEKVLVTDQNGAALLESNIIDPTVASPHGNTIEALFISPSGNGNLFFQESGDEHTNRIDPRHAHVPLDQNCTMETVDDPSLALLSLEDGCHNRDLYQTLEELPVTKVNHLLDDSEVTYRGMTSQSEPKSLVTQQVGIYSPKAIKVAVSNRIASPQLPLLNEPTLSRKRQRESYTKDSHGRILKSKRQRVGNSQENESLGSIRYWEPPDPEVERTLRLFPICSSQPVKVPRLNQPVVVLNHPDTDIPEVANIMRSVRRHKGAVQRVVLSQGTLKALSELSCNTFRKRCADNLKLSHCRRVWPQGTVKERFILNLKLKRLCGSKFKVANLSSNANKLQSSFRCWFCGRRFRNQEVWVGHGQRHIMEATRDWNKLFTSEWQGNDIDQQSVF